MTDKTTLRQSMIDACLEMASTGLTQGTSGNISVRDGARMLITPSAVPYDQMTTKMMATVQLAGPSTAFEGPCKPSSEWRIHEGILASRPEFGAVVHAHPPYCTTLAILRKSIPACHYMVAAFGGADVRCAEYATFGSAELASAVVTALDGRSACLMANHGMIAAGQTLAQAMWRAGELETLSQQYVQALQIGEPVLLSNAQIDETLQKFSGYGLT